MDYPKVDYHIHSHLSICARDSMTVESIVKRAEKRSFEAIAITDHVDVPEERSRCEELLEEIEKLEPNIRVLAGCEIEAFDTQLPVDEEFASKLDLVLISPNHFHSFPPERMPEDTPEANAAAFIDTLRRALSYPWVQVIAHPLILYETRHGLEEALNMAEQELRAIATTAASYGIAFEASPRALRAGSPLVVSWFYRLCAECGAKVSIGTDAHSLEKVCHLPHLYPLLERAGLTDSDILTV